MVGTSFLSFAAFHIFLGYEHSRGEEQHFLDTWHFTIITNLKKGSQSSQITKSTNHATPHAVLGADSFHTCSRPHQNSLEVNPRPLISGGSETGTLDCCWAQTRTHKASGDRKSVVEGKSGKNSVNRSGERTS